MVSQPISRIHRIQGAIFASNVIVCHKTFAIGTEKLMYRLCRNEQAQSKIQLCYIFERNFGCGIRKAYAFKG